KKGRAPLFPATWEIEEAAYKEVLNPCGCIMDHIRTPYRRKCRIFRDSDAVVTLSWFPAPEGAQYFPGSHLFASRDWRDRLEDWGRLGEIQEAKRRWTTGNPLPKYLGQCIVGDPDWYVNGVPASATATTPLPSCCAPPPEIGAAMLGGGPGMVGIISAGRNLRVGGLSFSDRK